MKKKFIPAPQPEVKEEPVHIYTMHNPVRGAAFSLVAKMGKEYITLMDFNYDEDGNLYCFPVNQLRSTLERFGLAPGGYGESIPILIQR